MNSQTFDIETRDFSTGSFSSSSFLLHNSPEWSIPVAYSVFWQLSKRRAGTAKVRARNDISGTTKKFVKQKGTGGARHGSRKCRPFVGGSVAHGPKLRSYEFKIPHLMLLKSSMKLMVEKIQTGSLSIFSNYDHVFKKTSDIVNIFGINKGFTSKILVIVNLDNQDSLNLAKSCRNIKNFKCTDYRFLTPLDMISCDRVFVDKAVFESFILKNLSLYGYVA